MSSASRRARPSVSSASRLASAIAWSAVCWARARTRAAVSMLSSCGFIITGSGRGGALRLVPGGLRHQLLGRGLDVRRIRGRRHWSLPATQHLGQLGPEFLVLLDQPVEFCLYLVEEGIHFLFVVAGPEPGRAE